MNSKLILMAMAAGAMLGAYGKSFTLDLRGSGKGGVKARLAASAQTQGADVLRSFDLDAGVADIGEVSVGDELKFMLFDDVALVLTLKEKMPSPLGGDAFLAEVAGYEGIRSAVVLRTSDGLTIDVQDFRNDMVYKVMSTPDGVKVQEIKPSHDGKCGCDTLDPAALGGARPAVSGTAEGSGVKASMQVSPRRLSSPGALDTYVDILVAYDKNAASWAKSNGGGLTNFAQTAVQKMNVAIANTGLDAKFRFRLVGIVTVSASSSSLDSALDAATTGSSGWEAIKAQRDEVGADIVTVLIDTGSAYGTTGLGWSLATTDFEWFSENAYNACAIQSVAQSYTMVHEVGHNMGCGHSDIQPSSPGPQLYGYSAGYYFSAGGEKHHTIMAYGTEGPGGSAVPYFSSPDYAYDGVAVGDATHNNTLTLMNTFAAVSKWRNEVGDEIGGEPSEEEMSNPLEWVTTREEAFAKARAKGKNIFLISGRDTCSNTMTTRNSSCEVPGVKRYLLRDYVCWYSVIDTQSSETSRYFRGYDIGNTLPFIAIIDVPKDETLAAEGGYHSASALRMMLGRVAKEVVFSPESGTLFEDSVQVTLSARSGAVIHYTLDGTIPDETSPRYEKPITLSSTATICAIAVVGGSTGLPIEANFVRERKMTVGGYEWTAHVIDGGCVVKSAVPAPSGDIAVPSRIGGFDVIGIDDGLFQGNAAITSIAIPPTVKEIAASQFFGCRTLVVINVDSANDDYSSAGGIVYDKTRKTLVCCPGGVEYLEIPDGVTGIAAGACQASEMLEGVLFPAGLKNIGMDAFASCSRLSEVVIPDSVEQIGWDAFSYCGQLKDAWLPERLKHDNMGYNSFYSRTGVALHYYSGKSTVVSVRFDANGGELETVERKSAVVEGKVVAVGALPVPLREKHKFLGWYTAAEGGTKVTATTKVTADVTYYAHWEYDGSSVVSAAVAEGCEAMGTVSGGGNLVKAGTKVTLKATANKGYVFVEWRDGTGAVVAQSASYTYVAKDEDVTLTAVFSTASVDADSLKVTVEDVATEEDGTIALDLGACVESMSQPKLAVSGLPTGLKFDAKTGKVTGKATKPGVYTVKVTATNASATGKKAVVETFNITVPNFKWDKEAVGVALEDKYLLQAGVMPALSSEVAAVTAKGWKLAVSGLPSGVKFDAKKGLFAGIASKEGFYTVYFTATKGKEKQIATATFEVAFPTLTLKVAAYGDESATNNVKLTGSGKYPAGKKVSLKAAAAKGSVFMGWYDDNGTLVAQSASYSYVTTDEDVTFTAVLVTSEEDRGSIKLKVDGVEMRRVEGNAPYRTNVWAGVYLEWPVAASALSATTVKVAGLPAGLKFADKPVTTKVGSGKAAVVVTNVPANTIYGAPTAASKATTDRKTGAVNVTPSAVKVTVTTAGKSSQTYQVDAVVDALPAWAQGTFMGALWTGARDARPYQNDDEEPNGIVSLAVSAAGKVSGKAQGDGLAYTLAAPYYSGFATILGDDGLVSNFLADVTASWSYKEGGKTIKVNDVVQMTVRDNGIGGYASAADWFYAYTVNWKAEPWKTLGKSFDKKTIAYAILSDGTFSENEEDLAAALGEDVVGRVSLKFAATGAVTVSGEFAAYDAKKAKYTTVKASGSATLIPVDEGRGVVFVYLAPKGLAPHVRSLDVSWPVE